MRFIVLLYVVAVFISMPFPAEAATTTQTLLNDHQTDAIYLFIVNDQTDPFIRFAADPVDFGRDAVGWSSTLFEDNTALLMQGDAIDPRQGRFRVTFDDGLPGGGRDSFDFTLEWAEYYQGTSLEQGSIYYSNGRYTGFDDSFNSTVPTPVPASVWMLVSGLGLLVGLRRYH